MSGLTVLAADPGLENFGIAVVRVDDTCVTVTGTALLTCAIRNLVFPQSMEQSKTFLSTWNDLLLQYSPQIVVAERFLVRGFGTANIELIGYMNGMIGALCQHHNIEYRTIVASQWKNSLNQKDKAKLKDVYKTGKAMEIVPHKIDAALIGTYVAQNNTLKGFKVTKAFLKTVKRGI